MEMVPFSVSCTSIGSRPAATIWWMVGETDVTNLASPEEKQGVDETFTLTSTLKYTVDRKFNLQPIICTANNTVGGFSNQINLFHNQYLLQTTMKEIYSMERFETVDIEIHVFSVPKYIYTAWFNNGKQIQTSTKFLFSESPAEVEDVFHGKTVKVNGYKSILTINGLTNEDFTNYTLILENGIGKPVEHTMVLEQSRHQQSETTVKFEKSDPDDHTHNYEEVHNSSGTQNVLQTNRDLRSSRNYEKLGLKDVSNVYEDLTKKETQKIGGQSSGTHYEDLGRKNEAYVYDDLNIEDAENKVYENASKQWTQEN
ncbi:unnamed protein product [Mytilus edulis]|uniref:Ig-like domain-containing protein n=1 Tax=Mytilus edulis TaxID=6550 RepID=A0A8S3Q8L5_MYTED|nr:unnamed protein product [Mytilus edulis]